MSPLFGEYFDILSEKGNLNEIQNVLDRSTGGSFRFETFLWDVLSGEINLDFASVLDMLGNVAFSGIHTGTEDVLRIIGVALLAAVFSNFTFSFRESHVADTAFYVCYIMMYGILAVTFYGAYEAAVEAIGRITGFMKVLVPAYCIAIVLGSGTVTSVYWYEAVIMLIAIAENVLLKVVLPLIGVHMTVNLAGNISNENILSKLCEMIELVVKWCLKGLTVMVIGVSGIQSMLAPAIDRFRRIGYIKTAESIPGIGGVIEGVNEALLGAGVLLKDAFGAGAMIALFLIGMIPAVRLSVYSLLYKAEAALIQPVSDRRIVNCINTASKASAMMVRAVYTASLLFIIAIALVTYSCI